MERDLYRINYETVDSFGDVTELVVADSLSAALKNFIKRHKELDTEESALSVLNISLDDTVIVVPSAAK